MCWLHLAGNNLGLVRNTGMEEIIRNRAIVNKVLLFETFVVVLAGFVFFIFTNLEFTYSIILGGFAYILPNAMFAKFSLKTSTVNSGNILVWFYVSEAIKVIATIVFFALSFLFFETLNPGLMILVYGIMLLGNLIGLSILIKN